MYMYAGDNYMYENNISLEEKEKIFAKYGDKRNLRKFLLGEGISDSSIISIGCNPLKRPVSILFSLNGAISLPSIINKCMAGDILVKLNIPSSGARNPPETVIFPVSKSFVTVGPLSVSTILRGSLTPNSMFLCISGG